MRIVRIFNSPMKRYQLFTVMMRQKGVEKNSAVQIAQCSTELFANPHDGGENKVGLWHEEEDTQGGVF